MSSQYYIPFERMYQGDSKPKKSPSPFAQIERLLYRCDIRTIPSAAEDAKQTAVGKEDPMFS